MISLYQTNADTKRLYVLRSLKPLYKHDFQLKLHYETQVSKLLR